MLGLQRWLRRNARKKVSSNLTKFVSNLAKFVDRWKAMWRNPLNRGRRVAGVANGLSHPVTAKRTNSDGAEDPLLEKEEEPASRDVPKRIQKPPG